MSVLVIEKSEQGIEAAVMMRDRLYAYRSDFGAPTLEEGMILPGIVTNITNFGVFVDIGVHQDGLVHISQLADRYVRDPNDVVKLHQHVTVKVREIDYRRNRISLTMKGIK